MVKIESHIVPALERKARLSDYAGGIFKTVPSRKGMKKAIDKVPRQRLIQKLMNLKAPRELIT